MTGGDRGIMVENFVATDISGLVVRDCDLTGITTPINNPDSLPIQIDNDNINVAPTSGWVNAARYGWHPLASGATNLAALDAALAGEADLDAHFADLVNREPELPEHLRKELRRG